MSSTALQPAQVSDSIARVGGEIGFTREKIQLIKDTVAKNTTDDELALFLYTAHRAGLDPLAKQIYCIKRWDSKLQREVAQPQTSIDGYRLIADRTGDYAPGRDPTYQYDAEGKLLSATAYVKKYVRGEWHEIAASAFWNEYVQTTKEGKPTAMWGSKPHIMLGKCAESLALRRAFPAELSGLYTQDEMGQAAQGDEGRGATIDGEVVTHATSAPPAPRQSPAPQQPRAVQKAQPSPLSEYHTRITNWRTKIMAEGVEGEAVLNEMLGEYGCTAVEELDMAQAKEYGVRLKEMYDEHVAKTVNDSAGVEPAF